MKHALAVFVFAVIVGIVGYVGESIAADLPRQTRLMAGLAAQDLHPTCTTDTNCEMRTK